MYGYATMPAAPRTIQAESHVSSNYKKRIMSLFKLV